MGAPRNGWNVRYMTASRSIRERFRWLKPTARGLCWGIRSNTEQSARSEEHTSELQSLAYLVCRLLLEKKKKDKGTQDYNLIILNLALLDLIYHKHSFT